MATQVTPELPPGFRAAGLHCGIKREAPDLGLLLTETATPATCLFTRNLLVGAHVTVGREHLAAGGGLVRAVLVNSGNANCATGARGLDDARRISAELAGRIGCPPEQVLFLSTGVIGRLLPCERIESALGDLLGSARADGLADFAQAILTTDTGPKVTRVGSTVGVAKGSGMIHPDMATMLAFLLTSAPLGLDAEAAHATLTRVSDRSFHRLSVDGDTSPNDMVLLWSSAPRETRVGESPQDALPAERSESEWTEVAQTLSRRIAADGEGATRLITIRITGAPSEEAAAVVGRTLATSPLVKTAIAGRDPNWGRLLSAAARAGVPFDATRARVSIGGSLLFDERGPHPEGEPAASRHMQDNTSVQVELDLGAGTAAAETWTCDLTADYVRINADYRT